MNLWERLLSALCAVWKTPQVNLTVPIQRTGFVQPKIQAFMAKVRIPALIVESQTGIPWRFAATQAGHESRWGQSDLTVQANNLFGVTGDKWAAQGKPVIWMPTTEYDAAHMAYVVRRPFRKYVDWIESLRDWAGLIQRIYPKALAAAKLGDFPGFADGLLDGIPDGEGRPLKYATDPKYAQKLKDIHASLEGIG